MMVSLELAQTISVNQGSAIDLCLKVHCVGPCPPLGHGGRACWHFLEEQGLYSTNLTGGGYDTGAERALEGIPARSML